MNLVRMFWELPDWRSRAVVRRHSKVFFRSWKTLFAVPMLEPIVHLLAFGALLGVYVNQLEYAGETVRYADYIAPGLLAAATFQAAFLESLYEAFVRMRYQKTWDGMLGSQVELHHVLWGEILWGGVRSLCQVAMLSLGLMMVAWTGWLDIAWYLLPLLVPLGFFVGVVVSALGLLCTVAAPSIHHLKIPIFFIGIPTIFLSNTYFPVTPESPVLYWLLQLDPVLHLAETLRSVLLTRTVDHHLGLLLVTGTGFFIVCAGLAQHLAHRRLRGG